MSLEYANFCISELSNHLSNWFLFTVDQVSVNMFIGSSDLFSSWTKLISGVIVSGVAMSAVDCGCNPWLGKIKDYKLVFVASPWSM